MLKCKKDGLKLKRVGGGQAADYSTAFCSFLRFSVSAMNVFLLSVMFTCGNDGKEKKFPPSILALTFLGSLSAARLSCALFEKKQKWQDKINCSPGETYKRFIFEAHVPNASQGWIALNSYIWCRTACFYVGFFSCFIV